MKVAFYTLGCKMNFHETAFMEGLFRKSGYELVDFSEKSDIYIVNTCTVTKNADAKSRKALRKAKRINKNALTVAVGCYPEVYPEELSKMKEVDLVLGNAEKFNIVEIVEKRLNGKFPRVFIKGIWNERIFHPLVVDDYEGKARAFLKIQQGCEHFCSYCIIPYARGRCLSESSKSVVEQAERLSDLGYREIVLTGTDIGSYSDSDTNLAKLILSLSDIKGLKRIRISSIEPMTVTDELLDVACFSEKVAPHFHIPLQSGSDRVLRDMRRNYSTTNYQRLISKIISKRPNACIGTDVIVGFPTETTEEFKRTKAFLNDMPFSYIHVFPYSARRKTIASIKWPDCILPEVKRKRSEAIRNVAERKSITYRKGFIGKILSCISLGNFRALSGNYINVKIDRNVESGKTINVRLTSIGEKRDENYGSCI